MRKRSTGGTFLQVLAIACGAFDLAPPPGWADTDGVVAVQQPAADPGWTDVGFSPPVRTQVSQYIRTMLQDRSGSLWFGTQDDGVCRYDGKALACYSVSAGLGGPSVRDILQDRKGTLWFATSGGLSRFDGTKFSNWTVAEGLAHDDVWSLLEDRSGTIWIATVGGVSRLDGGRLSAFPLPPATARDFSLGVHGPSLIWSLLEDRAGNLWLGTAGDGLTRFDGKSFARVAETDGLASRHIQSLLEDRAGTLWVGTSGGLYRLDGKRFVNVTRESIAD